VPIEDQIEELTHVVRQGFADLIEKFGKPQTAMVEAKPAVVEAKALNGADKKQGPSFEEVTAIAQKLAQVKTPAAAMKLINAHGAPRLAQLPEEKYAAFVEAASVMLSEKTAEL
jgi:hypothetical protein